MTLPAFPRPRRRGIYILPNLFTTAALFCGFFAIVQAMNKHFEIAAIAIFVAMVFDGLDGRIARLTQTQSEFGAEYDSLSDMVCFGAAPALVVYEWALMGLGKLGWIVAFIYCAGAALRLARFNTNIDVVDKRFFQGLPSPAAAALIAGLVWVGIDNGMRGEDVRWLACLLTLFAGISMVSNVPFWSGKSINLRKSVPFIAVIALVLAFALGASYPPGIFFALFVGYALSGYALYIWRWRQQRHAQEAATAAAEPSPDGDESDTRHASMTEAAQSIHSADTLPGETPPARPAQSSPDSEQSEQV
ncbi:MAG: CDP-diacylglycerol--serine O-phosphatidyltransferase [Azoarcus sp.]|jgi:CDP-diacylglycerol--serine O-phosphatidyltransferase|nr:CDP-diacylglycerol--serine O-phosphatidyltransferase [Azoarcus sp.]